MIHALGFIRPFFDHFYDNKKLALYSESTVTLNGILYLKTPGIVA